ncbi:MAG: hypothetical protein AAF581_03240 [Planctomycetota bacterium]
MVRISALLVIVALTLGVGTWIDAQDGGNDTNGARPLDLPAGKVVKDDEDENDPESIIFYGQEYEADAFFWCVDRSCSMDWGAGPPIVILKAELQASIESLSKQAEFGIVNFSSGYQKYKPMPVKATPGEKVGAMGWVQAMSADGSTCLGAAGVATLEIANLCRKRNKRMICMADGGANCPGCGTEVPQITNANWQRIPIDTLFVGGSGTGLQCMTDLANANGGTFAHIAN